MNKKNGISSTIHNILNLDNSLEKMEIKKNSSLFHIRCWTGFLMIQLTTVYDNYIDRPKLTEERNEITVI